MSDYTAVIHCKKCNAELSRIRAYHDRPGMFVPQDIMTKDFQIDSIFCQACLNADPKEEVNV